MLSSKSKQSQNLAFTVGILMYLVGLGPTSFQIFLPAIPNLQSDFQAPAATVNLTVSLSLMSFAVASLGYGFLADRFRRRQVMCFGMLTLILGSLICSLGTSIEAVILGRFIQPVGGAAGVIGARIMVMDLFKNEKAAANAMSKLTATMMVAPLLGVPLGGWLTDHFGWRSNCYFILGAATLGLFLVLFGLRQIRENHSDEGGKKPSFLSYRELLRSRSFWCNTLQFALSQSVFMTLMTATPAIYTKTLHYSASEMSLILLLFSLSSVAGNLFSSKFLGNVIVRYRLILGSLIGCVSGLFALGFSWFNIATVIGMSAPIIAFSFGYGIASPAAQFGFMNAIPRLSGAAAGLSIFLSMQMAGLSTQIAASRNDGALFAVTPLFAALTLFALGAALLTPKQEHR